MSFNNILKYFVAMIFSIIFSSCLKKDVFKPNPCYESGESTLPTMYIEMPEMDCYNIHMSKEKKAEAECMMYLAETNTQIEHDTTFFENTDVVIQYQYRAPSRVEMYRRRVKKKLKRILYMGY